MRQIIVDSWDNIGYKEQYEVIRQQTKYPIREKTHRIEFTFGKSSIVYLTNRVSGKIEYCIEVVERKKKGVKE